MRKKILVTHKMFLNPSNTMVATLRWENDTRVVVVPPMSVSNRIRIFDGEMPTITWVKRKENANS
jgi:hypothetical protein